MQLQKKIYGYLVICILCTLIVNSCRKEEPAGPQDVEIAVSASFASDTIYPESPLVDSSLYWQNGDQINVFNAKNNIKCIAKLNGKSGVAQFLGSSNEDLYPSADNPIFGLFPYQEDAICEGGTIIAKIAEKQTGRAGSFSRNANIFVAQSDSYSLSFHNICSGIKFSLKNDNITEIVIKSLNGEQIAGKARISFKENVPLVENAVDGLDEISISLPDGQCFKAGEWYYISTLPCTLEFGISITLYTADKYASKKFGDRMELSSGKFMNLDILDNDLDDYTQEKLIFIDRGDEIWNNKELSVYQRLMSLPDVVSIYRDGEMTPTGNFVMKMKFRLPIDHNDTSKGYFLNKVDVAVIDPDSLNVIIFSGYQNHLLKNDIADLLNGNSFAIEHRDFGSSLTNTEYAYLTTAQAAADQKQIIDNLKLMFHRRFAVTGSSKGGITTALLAGYYPELDMVYIPLVAPFCTMPDDVKGHTRFLERFMTAEIRERMINLQRKMLALMDNAEVMDEFSKSFNSSPSRRPDYSVKDAFYYQVQEYYPIFWQNIRDASKLPDQSLEGLELWKKVKSLLLIDYDLDEYVYNIQSLRELGSFGYHHNFSDIYTPQCKEFCRARVPQQCRQDVFDSGTFEKYINIAVSKTERPMLFLYGENDIWTTWAIDDRLINGTNVRKYIVPGGFHNIGIHSFQDEAINKEIEDWIKFYMYR